MVADRIDFCSPYTSQIFFFLSIGESRVSLCVYLSGAKKRYALVGWMGTDSKRLVMLIGD